MIEFTISIPVSYLGGIGSDYGFQIGLVKHVNEADWQDGWGNWPGDPGGEGWSTNALIFVQLPSEGWDSWESEVTPAPPTKAAILSDSDVPGKGLENAPGQQKPFNPNSKAGEHAGKK